jgi:hypothetical protein
LVREGISICSCPQGDKKAEARKWENQIVHASKGDKSTDGSHREALFDVAGDYEQARCST